MRLRSDTVWLAVGVVRLVSWVMAGPQVLNLLPQRHIHLPDGPHAMMTAWACGLGSRHTSVRWGGSLVNGKHMHDSGMAAPMVRSSGEHGVSAARSYDEGERW